MSEGIEAFLVGPFCLADLAFTEVGAALAWPLPGVEAEGGDVSITEAEMLAMRAWSADSMQPSRSSRESMLRRRDSITAKRSDEVGVDIVWIG